MFRDDDVTEARRRYGAARQAFDDFAAQLRAAEDAERVARAEKEAACVVCATARTQYDDSKNRTKRTLGTYQLFVFGREGGLHAAGGSRGGAAGADGRGGQGAAAAAVGGGGGGGGGGGEGAFGGRRLQKKMSMGIGASRGLLSAAPRTERKGKGSTRGRVEGAGEGKGATETNRGCSEAGRAVGLFKCQCVRGSGSLVFLGVILRCRMQQTVVETQGDGSLGLLGVSDVK